MKNIIKALVLVFCCILTTQCSKDSLPESIVITQIYEKIDEQGYTIYKEIYTTEVLLYENGLCSLKFNGEDDDDIYEYKYDGHVFSFYDGDDWWDIQCLTKKSSSTLSGSKWLVSEDGEYNEGDIVTFNEDGTWFGDVDFFDSYSGGNNSYSYNGKVLKTVTERVNNSGEKYVSTTILQCGNMLYQMMK